MKLLCLLCAGENTLTLYDADLKKVREFGVKGIRNAGPRKMAFADGFFYCANSFDGSVSRIDARTGAETAREICVYPTGIVSIPPTGLLAVTCGETDRLILIDSDLRVVEATGCKSFPLSLTLSRDQNRLVCACLSQRKVKIYDSRTFLFKTEIDVEGYPYYAVEDASGTLYAAFSDDGYFAEGKVAAYRGKQKAALGDAGRMPTTVCIAEDAGRVYVANTGGNSVDILERETLRRLGGIQTGNMPDDILCDGGRVYVSCMAEDSLMLADTDGRVLKHVATDREPRGLAMVTLEDA